jgi:hypothetical protein
MWQKDSAYSFDDLASVAAALREAFHSARIMPPATTDSHHVRRDKFLALLAAAPAPEVTRFCAELEPHVSQLVADVCFRRETVRRSAVLRVPGSEIVRETILYILRNCENWLNRWRAEGAPEQNDWKGYLLASLGQVLNRRERRLRRGMPPAGQPARAGVAGGCASRARKASLT